MDTLGAAIGSMIGATIGSSLINPNATQTMTSRQLVPTSTWSAAYPSTNTTTISSHVLPKDYRVKFPEPMFENDVVQLADRVEVEALKVRVEKLERKKRDHRERLEELEVLVSELVQESYKPPFGSKCLELFEQAHGISMVDVFDFLLKKYGEEIKPPEILPLHNHPTDNTHQNNTKSC
jgi:hypothetical protein